MKKYKYNKCSKCGEDKPENRSTYCKRCSSEYHRNYALVKKLKCNIDLNGLKSFINKIELQNNYGTVYDMLTICFFYEIITTDIHEYWNYDTQTQVNLMYWKIYNYYIKEISSK